MATSGGWEIWVDGIGVAMVSQCVGENPQLLQSSF